MAKRYRGGCKKVYRDVKYPKSITQTTPADGKNSKDARKTCPQSFKKAPSNSLRNDLVTGFHFYHNPIHTGNSISQNLAIRQVLLEIDF